MNNSTSVALNDAPVTTLLADWSRATELALQAGELYQAVALAQVVLRHIPRHLLTYQRLVRAAWRLKRWEEGEEWGRRLLRADPTNGPAWQALAQAAELRERRAQAHAIWQRAFEAEPYEPEIRAGLSRTSLRVAHSATAADETLALNLACLARLYLRSYRWERAAALYHKLTEVDPRRIDFQIGLLVALWHLRARQESYQHARALTRQHPHLILAWTVVGALGDENDQALARNPIETMDPDGEFVRSWLGNTYERSPVKMIVNAREAELLDAAKS